MGGCDTVGRCITSNMCVLVVAMAAPANESDSFTEAGDTAPLCDTPSQTSIAAAAAAAAAAGRLASRIRSVADAVR